MFWATAEAQDGAGGDVRGLPDVPRRVAPDARARSSASPSNTEPLVRDLQPVADDLAPTIRDVSRAGAGPGVAVRRPAPADPRRRCATCPRASASCAARAPVLEALHPFLQELNPILSYANFNQNVLAGFVTNALAGVQPRPRLRASPRTASSTTCSSSSASSTTPRCRSNRRGRRTTRGNAYIEPNENARAVRLGIRESFDCKVARRRAAQPDPESKLPPCYVKAPSLFGNRLYPAGRVGEARRTSRRPIPRTRSAPSRPTRAPSQALTVTT